MKNLTHNHHYQQLLADVKQRIQQAQVKAVIAANQELLILYWEIGQLKVARQTKEGWGTNGINQLSADLKKTFPNMKGFSPRNLGYMKRFASTYADFLNLQVPLAKISWSHNITLRQEVEFFGIKCYISTKEDLIISKLKWYNITPSEKQMEDLRFLLLDKELDSNYLKVWCLRLNIITYGLLE